RVALTAMCELARSRPAEVVHWLVPAFPVLQESAGHELWDENLVDALSEAVVRQARDAGALAGLPASMVYGAGYHILFGELCLADTLLTVAESFTTPTDHRGPVRYHRLIIAAWRRDAVAAARVIEAAASDAEARGEARLMGLTGYPA